MAEEDSSQEKTEEPTQKKLEKAAEDGQVPRSTELNTLFVLIAGSGGLLTFGQCFMRRVLMYFKPTSCCGEKRYSTSLRWVFILLTLESKWHL
jgi:flagellar biosynthesis protein FlhB